MTSFLERPNAGHRAVAAAVVAHLLGMSVEAATQGSAPEELLASVKPGPLASALMARLSDKEAPVRIQAVTGLASLAPMWSAEAGDALADLGVQAGTLAGAIVSAAGDAAEDVACAALDSLTKVGGARSCPAVVLPSPFPASLLSRSSLQRCPRPTSRWPASTCASVSRPA